MNKTAPQNIEAERALIGAILLRPSSLIKVLEKIKPESFFNAKHQIVYSAISELFLNKEPVDIVSLSEKLQNNKQLAGIGGIMFLNELMSIGSMSANIESYAEIVDKNYKRRLIIGIADTMSTDAFDEKEVESIVSDAVTDITNILKDKEDNSFNTAIEDVYKKAKEYQENGEELFGISTGINEIDIMLDGLQEGQFIGFAAYTSQGKTWDALNIAAEQIKKGRKFAFFSLEMGAEQIVTRLASILTGLDVDKIRKGQLEVNDKKRIVGAMNKIKNSGSTIYGNQKLDSIKLTILKEGLTNKPDLFILDYLQLISSDGKAYETLTEAAHYFQNALMKSKIPMFALSQISNESAKDSSNDLLPFKGSGDIGASLSTAIYKKSKHKSKKEVGERLKRGIPLESEWVVMKNRDGDKVGSVTVYFDNVTKRNIGQKEFEEVYGLERYYTQIKEMEEDIKAEKGEF